MIGSAGAKVRPSISSCPVLPRTHFWCQQKIRSWRPQVFRRPWQKTECEKPHTAPSLEFWNDGRELVSRVDVMTLPFLGTGSTYASPRFSRCGASLTPFPAGSSAGWDFDDHLGCGTVLGARAGSDQKNGGDHGRPDPAIHPLTSCILGGEVYCYKLLRTGTRATTSVPLALELISRLPPISRMRSVMPAKPTPLPEPSSRKLCTTDGGIPRP